MDLLNLMRASFPKTINKGKPIFSGIIANDNKDASIQKQLIDLSVYMKEWISTPDIYQQTGEMLQKTINFFSYLEQFAGESETSLKNRFRAIFERNHDTKWGTPYDIKSVFKQYFPHANIYLVENTNDVNAVETELGNLFVNGDIETEEAEGWTLTNCEATKNARFSGKFGIELAQSNASLSQSVNVISSKPYFLHFFLHGKVIVQIKDNNNKYWKNSTKTWENSAVNNVFESETWDNETLYFITSGSTTGVTITFSYIDSQTFVDYFRLFKKQPYGSFTVIIHFDGESAAKAFGLASGTSDPNIETTSPTPPLPRYDNYGYFDKSFLSGVAAGFATDLYNDLIGTLRAQGVKAYFDILLMDL